MNIRIIVPRPAKVGLRWVQRRWADYQSGMYGQLAGTTNTDAVSLLLTPALELEQPIMPSAFFENKVHNMQTAATRIQQVLLLPGQVFSFWHVVGYPGARKGDRKSDQSYVRSKSMVFNVKTNDSISNGQRTVYLLYCNLLGKIMCVLNNGYN